MYNDVVMDTELYDYETAPVGFTSEHDDRGVLQEQLAWSSSSSPSSDRRSED